MSSHLFPRIGAALTTIASLAFATHTALAADPALAAAPAAQPADTRYGILNLLDHRSRYGQYWFPEPMRVDETDVDNELRLDGVHLSGTGHVVNDGKAEFEKSFGLLTLELEVPYERETVTTTDVTTGRKTREKSEGVGNISLGARHPVFQYVSPNDYFDNTVVAGFEAGLPTHSTVSKNTELVPKLIDDLRLGEHFSVQTILGYSALVGPAPDGGTHTFEYAAVMGYSLERQELALPGIERLIPMLELKGETGLNQAESGHHNLTGTLGCRVNLSAIGAWQPRLGVGYVFPLDREARDDFKWGVVTSLVFEF